MSEFKFERFSKKQLTVLSWWYDGSPYCKYDGIICDGAVRSGKTTCMTISFVLWAFYRFDGADFALCGKTITSLRRNIVTPLLPLLSSLGFEYKEKLSQNLVEISDGKRKNRFYLFGGRDESSAALIQGMTLTGVLLDEVALMPRSFVEQALARCSPAGAKYWFNCNPENPLHWFYEEWIKKAQSKNCLYLHFHMQDNPSLSAKVIKRYEKLYSGTFYERFVLGKWVATQGLVYPEAASGKFTSEVPCEEAQEYCISCDYGTVNPFSLGLWARYGSKWYRKDQQADILTSEIDSYRREITPVIRSICSLWLRLNGFGCDFDVEWDNVTLQDITEIAKSGLYEAQSEKIYYEMAGENKNA